MSDSFDAIFSGASVRSNARRKLDDGSSRSVKLTAVPSALSLDAFSETAMKGATASRRIVERGVTLSQSVDCKGVAARSALLAMADKTEAPEAPAPKRERAAKKPENMAIPSVAQTVATDTKRVLTRDEMQDAEHARVIAELEAAKK